MRCNICNNVLSEKEIQYNSVFESFDPCGTCLQEIAEVYEDYPDDAPSEEPEIIE